MIVLQNAGILGAFAAGLAMFFTPCTLPLIPAWISTFGGAEFGEMLAADAKPRKSLRFKVFLRTVFFVSGFGLVFTFMGAAATALGDFLLGKSDVLRYVGAFAMTIFGLSLLGVIKPWRLFGEKRLKVPELPAGLLGAFLVGIAFAAGWTPCSGPVLASMLALAATRDGVLKGMELLGFFSLGLAVPFLVLSLLLGKLFPLFKKIGPRAVWASRFLGVCVLVLAFLLLTDKIGLITPQVPGK
ncbi:MAG: cytochrome c biogenesis protein CcdA [Deltaproteobacteria bacterium]|jgi:cytochrome c-type biogenesis protein|nr:cytochrome c biogenesis protein CcdA [Deltaproteobacteria bacterium]